MPSVPRSAILGDDCYFHVTWQCHNKDRLLRESWAKKLYYDLLLRFKDRYGVTIYAYCFMDNHPHLCGHLTSLERFSDFFRIVNSLFARIYNQRVIRQGQVVMDRFKSPCVQTDRDCLRLMRYIDLNPLRAGKVRHPRENEFSSYAYYAHGRSDPLITSSPSYLGMGGSARERQMAYRAMVAELLEIAGRVRQSFSTSFYIGNPEWVAAKYAELRRLRFTQQQSWHERFRERYGTASC